MATIEQLTTSAKQLRDKANGKMQEATKHQQKSMDFFNSGDSTHSQTEATIATKLQTEALALQQQAADYDQQALDLGRKVQALDQQKNDIQTSMQAQITKLDQQKRALE